MTFFWRHALDKDIRAVVDDLRDIDAREIFAGRFDDDDVSLVSDICAAQSVAIAQLCLGRDEQPVAILSAYHAGARVAQVAMFATPMWPRIAQSAHAFIVRQFIPSALIPHVHRAECRVMEENVTAHRWLNRLGFADETQPFPLGKNGERFVQVAWRNPTDQWRKAPCASIS